MKLHLSTKLCFSLVNCPLNCKNIKRGFSPVSIPFLEHSSPSGEGTKRQNQDIDLHLLEQGDWAHTNLISGSLSKEWCLGFPLLLRIREGNHRVTLYFLAQVAELTARCE